MSGPTKLHPSERVDLADLTHVAEDYPRSLQTDLIRAVVGAGVFDGFRCRVLPDAGTTKGFIEIYNGRGSDHQGSFINSQTGTLAERIHLPAASTEYWIEIEFRFADAFPDARVFFDPTKDQPDPIPDGEEVSIPRTFTRRIITWRVKQPMSNNQADARDGVGYTPSHFSDNDSLVLPLYVLRTNSSGEIKDGNPDTDADGNDIATFTTAEGANRRFVKYVGYGESEHFESGGAVARGRKTSDQRPRVFEPLLPPFLGPEGEVVGETASDFWMRDYKSTIDHLCSAIGQIKHGAGESLINTGQGDFGQFFVGLMETMDPSMRWVDILSLFQNEAQPGGATQYEADPDQFIGCTLQIMGGHWGGFYAQIRGNDATVGTDTRVYLGRHSPVPDWKELNASFVLVRIVQHRQKNWTAKPSPDSNFRGLNDLDTEVVTARTDLHSIQTFDNLKQRLDANKYATLTFYEPLTSPIEVAAGDVSLGNTLASITAAITKMNTIKTGVIFFREGIYGFNSYGPTSPNVFVLGGRQGLIFKGVGRSKTRFSFDSETIVNNIFSLTSCTDIEFHNMAFEGKGTILSFDGCANIKFVNCLFAAQPSGTLTTPNLFLGAAEKFTFEDCTFFLSDSGIQADSFIRGSFRNCEFKQYNEAVNASVLNYFLELGNVTASKFLDSTFLGYASKSAIKTSSFSGSTMRNVFVECNVLNSGAGGVAIVDLGAVVLSHIDAPVIRLAVGGDNSTPRLLNFSQFWQSQLTNLIGEGALDGVVVDSLAKAANSEFINCSVKGVGLTAGSHGFNVRESTEITMRGCRATLFDVGFYLRGVFESKFADNIARDVNSGFDCDGDVAPSVTKCSFTGNLVSNPEDYGFNMRSANINHLSGNHVEAPSGSTAGGLVAYDLTTSAFQRGGHIDPGTNLAGGFSPIGFAGDSINNNNVAVYNVYDEA